MIPILEKIIENLRIGDTENEVALSEAGPWATFAIELGYRMGFYNEQDSRVVCCVSSPETTLFGLLVGFGCIIAASQTYSDSEMLTFSKFMTLQPGTRLYWLVESQKQTGIVGNYHNYEGGGRKITLAGGGEVAIFKSNYHRYNFKFSQSQINLANGNSEITDFYNSLGLLEVNSILTALEPTVITHGKKGKTFQMANDINLLTNAFSLSIRKVLNISLDEGQGLGSYRLYSDTAGSESSKCQTVIVNSSRKFDKVVRKYLHSNLLFLFDHSEFTNHALLRMSELCGNSAPHFPSPPGALCCQTFVMNR